MAAGIRSGEAIPIRSLAPLLACGLLLTALAGCGPVAANACARFLLSQDSPIERIGPFEPGRGAAAPSGSQPAGRPPWQPQPGEYLVGVANGDDARSAVLQFQKMPGATLPRSLTATRLVRYRCDAGPDQG